MSQLNTLYIAATGMITPIGADSEMTAASVRAGISGYNLSKFNSKNCAINLASVPNDALEQISKELVDTEITSRQERMLRLSHSALKQIPQLSKPPALFLAGPEPLQGGALPLRSKFLEHLQIQSGITFNLESSKVFPMGRAAGFYALECAFDHLQSTSDEYVIVGGVDTYNDPLVLGALANEERLKTDGYDSDAFVPGEASCFILLTTNGKDGQYRQVCRPGISEESGHRYSNLPYQGDGLSNAFRVAIENFTEPTVYNIFSSLNGESLGAKEHGVAITRNRSCISDSTNIFHTADCHGDLGGATSSVLIALSAIISAKPSICYGSSEDEFRGAVCVI